MPAPSRPARRWRVHWKDGTGAWRARSFQIEKSADDVVRQLSEQGTEGVRKEDRWDDQARFAITIDFGVPYRADLHAELAIQLGGVIETLRQRYGIDRDAVEYGLDRDQGAR